MNVITFDVDSPEYKIWYRIWRDIRFGDIKNIADLYFCIDFVDFVVDKYKSSEVKIIGNDGWCNIFITTKIHIETSSFEFAEMASTILTIAL